MQIYRRENHEPCKGQLLEECQRDTFWKETEELYQEGTQERSGGEEASCSRTEEALQVKWESENRPLLVNTNRSYANN